MAMQKSRELFCPPPEAFFFFFFRRAEAEMANRGGEPGFGGWRNK